MRLSALVVLLAAALSMPAFAVPTVINNSAAGINNTNLAVVVNDLDPLSVQIGNYYAEQRKIPAANVLHVKFTPGATVMTPAAFTTMKQTLDASTPAGVQGYLLTWVAPYRVGTESMTTAFALGYDVKYTSPTVCSSTAPNPYFNSTSRAPWTELKVRPTMMLGAQTFAEAQALVTRGKLSEASHAPGYGYLVSTTDVNRNVRASSFDTTIGAVQPYTDTVLSKEYTNALVGKKDIMFYFTGVANVASLTTNTFLPGAVGDHLTSYGGMLTNSSQMSSLKWLQAGATASYGTVVEPCNYTYKFPNPRVMMNHYMAGNTVLEAYWKSVNWPGEGVFVGEPLARPYMMPKTIKNADATWSVKFSFMPAGNYSVVTYGDPTMAPVTKTVTVPTTGAFVYNLGKGDNTLTYWKFVAPLAGARVGGA